MKKKKGFTLIELLAVIVILAIIALIATPAIINVIENARKKAFEDTSYGVLEGLRLDYIERTAQGTSAEEKIFNFPNSGLKLSGEEPAFGSAKIDGKGNISFALADKDKRWCAKKEATSEKVTIEDYSEENCKIDGTSGGGEANPTATFRYDSWETIANAVKNGNTSNYNVGDEKMITLTGKYAGTYTVRIANMSSPSECSNSDFSQTACGFVVEFRNIITSAVMNSEWTNKGGFPSSEIYNLLNTDIYNSLPEDLKKVIIDTKVVSSHGSMDANNFTSTDKLYLLSTKEVWGKQESDDKTKYDTSEANTRQLDYYIKNPTAIKRNNSSVENWWLRSAASNKSNEFYYVTDVGGSDASFSSMNYGVAPAFRIG